MSPNSPPPPPDTDASTEASTQAVPRRALVPDRRGLRWWGLSLLGAACLGWAIGQLVQLPLDDQWPAWLWCVVVLLAARFPWRMPGSPRLYTGSGAGVILAISLHGAAPAVLAAVVEAMVLAPHRHRSLPQRLLGAAAAATAMTVAGGLCAVLLPRISLHNIAGQAGLLAVLTATAALNLMLRRQLVRRVVQRSLADGAGPGRPVDDWRWPLLAHSVSGLIAGFLALAVEQQGTGVLLMSVPMLLLVLALAHDHLQLRASEVEARAQQHLAAQREAQATARHLAELRASQQRFHSAFSHAAIGMALVARDGRVLQANAAMLHLLDCQEQQLVGQDFQNVVHPDDWPLLQAQWQQLLERPRSASQPGPDGHDAATELRCRRPAGDHVLVALHSGLFAEVEAVSDPDPDPDPDPGGMPRETLAACLILQAQDITARRDAEARLQHIAYHDSLTSLANRIRFGACLAQAIARCQADPAQRFAVMYLDFDRFKLINDTLGHAAGDRFLSLAARRISATVRPGDTVGRLGGDEFAVLVLDVADEADVLAMAERLQQALSAVWLLDDVEVVSGASIGITFSSVGYDSPDEVLRDADIAMYRAKAAGRGRTVVFDASLRAQLAAQVNLERALRQAIEQSQLTLVYQPICDLATGQVESFEALVRWEHPELGPMQPDTFVPLAEESALIGSLTGFVLERACRQMRAMRRQMPDGWLPRVHVNVSGTDMCRAGFVQQVAQALRQGEMAPQQLTLEITETMLMQRLDSALEVMGALRQLGVGLSVDDFGTGYSSLAYLSTLPITSLKIDRSFVQRLVDADRDAEVVKAVITLGRALGKTVIAEGIETLAQLQRLRALGCLYGQGYLLAKPLRSEQAMALAGSRQLPLAPLLPAPEPGRVARSGDTVTMD